MDEKFFSSNQTIKNYRKRQILKRENDRKLRLNRWCGYSMKKKIQLGSSKYKRASYLHKIVRHRQPPPLASLSYLIVIGMFSRIFFSLLVVNYLLLKLFTLKEFNNSNKHALMIPQMPFPPSKNIPISI